LRKCHEQAKFYSTFAFLFGLGMATQYARAQAKGMRFVPFYLRRLAVLLGFGLIHAYLLWVGDILIRYSVSNWWLARFCFGPVE